jgi:hypothetical protein
MHDDKNVIECWLKLYNRLNGTTFSIKGFPDDDSSKPNVDAVCVDAAGQKLAIEHTRIEPFEGEKADAERFLKTLGSLENHPELLQPAYSITISQAVGAFSTGIKRSLRALVATELINEIKAILPTLTEGQSVVTVRGAKWSVDLRIDKSRIDPGDPPTFWTSRTWPGDPGPELILTALERKVPKLAVYTGYTRILLLDKYAIAGTVESQFALLPTGDAHIDGLLGSINEIWSVNTSILETEGWIYSNQVWPKLGFFRCGLNLGTGEFWRGPC